MRFSSRNQKRALTVIAILMALSLILSIMGPLASGFM